jgi:hypothetical protein
MSSNTLVLAAEGGVSTGAALPANTNPVLPAIGEDPFQIAFRVAAPTLSKVKWLQPHFKFINAYRRSGRDPLKDNDPHRLLRALPTGDRLADVGALFGKAEDETASEDWVHVVLGLMVDSLPGAKDVSDAFRHGIIDTMYRDPFGGSYSAPVICMAIREATRTVDGLPSPARFVSLCEAQRAQFRKWRDDVDALMELRYRVEDFMEEQNKKLLPPPEVAAAADDDGVWGDLGYGRHGRA